MFENRRAMRMRETEAGRRKNRRWLFNLLLIGIIILFKPKSRHDEGIICFLWVASVVLMAYKTIFWLIRAMVSSASSPASGWYNSPMSGSQPDTSAADARREADRRVWERTKAQNEAAFHDYYARQNRGTYAGYQAHNRAMAARERAKRL